MKCQVCNADAAQGASFCQHCGAKLPLFDESTSTFEAADVEAAASGSPPATAAPQSDGDSGYRRDRKGDRRDIPEETLWEGTYSPKAMLGLAVFCAVMSVLLLVVAIAFASGGFRWFWLLVILALWIGVGCWLAARRLGIRYKLTTHMFYHQRGVLTRVTDRIELIEVHDVTYQQGLFERITGVGKIKVESSDRTHPVFFVTGVEHVEQVAQMIDKARRSEQVRRGRRIDFSHIDGET